jgi:hypothetical protein
LIEPAANRGLEKPRPPARPSATVDFRKVRREEPSVLEFMEDAPRLKTIAV